MSIKIGPSEFSTKAKATEYVCSILSKYTIGQFVDDHDFDFLVALLSRHPEHRVKEGCGVMAFSRGEHPKFRSPCFVLHRIDGSHTDFSTVTCIKGEGPSVIAEWREACREAVDAQILARKNAIYDENGGRVSCPETGEVLGKGQYWLVQVDPTWSTMVDEFISVYGISPSKEDISIPADNQFWAEFRDRELARNFAEFHASRMQLIPKKARF